MAEEEDRENSGVGSLVFVGEDDWWESMGWCRGVRDPSIGGRSGAEDSGTARIGGCDSVGMVVASSGAICGGREDVGAVSSAREPRTVDMTAVASMGSAGAMEGVASARVAASDMGVD